MSALNEARNIETVGDLLDYLNECEEEWSSEDQHFLGDFRDQPVKAPVWSKVADGRGKGLFRFSGYTGAQIKFTIYSWFIVDHQGVM